MLTKVYRYFFPAPTVSQITASFDKKVSQLRAVADAKVEEASVCSDQINSLRDKRDAADKESERAEALADRIEMFTTV